ncbi:MAG: hypothetical protein HY318_00300, partial [Armatimonadetes bacterium]|nr:hypothetical protein [Armatimonadota bacterium]
LKDPNGTRAISEADLDDCPGLVTTMLKHRGKKVDGQMKSIHQFIDEAGLPPVNGVQYDTPDILAQLQTAYHNADMDDVWVVAKKWLQSKNVAGVTLP